MGKDCVHALGAVHELRDSQVGDDTREGKSLAPLETELAAHELEERIDRDRRGLVEILVEAEREPCFRCPGDRRRQRQVVANGDREPCALDGSLDRELRDLAVTLRRVAVAGREECAVDGDGQEERRAGDELLAVDVAAGGSRWRRSNGCPGSAGGMPMTPRNGRIAT